MNTILNLIGFCRQIHSGGYYYCRFSLPRYFRGEYPWMAAIGDTPAAAKAAARGLPRVKR